MWTPDAFYHISSRGNRRDSIFLEKNDFNVFLYILRQVNEQTPFELASYCLMSNHYHLQMRSKVQPISNVMSRINKRYADYFNNKYNLTGHVFEKRYFADIIEPGAGMLEVSRYIHLNPVRANIVAKPEQYPWSSYRYYLFALRYDMLVMDDVLSYFSGNDFEKRQQYRAYMEEKQQENYVMNY